MISSRLTNKPSKKERPKSVDKGTKAARKSRDAGTPEKSASPQVFPTDDCEPELATATIHISTDLDLQQFAFNEEEMKSKRIPHPPLVEKPSAKVMVSKSIQENPLQDKIYKRRILVARKAPSNSDVKGSQLEDFHGLDVAGENAIKPHAILGSLHDFRDQAEKHGISIKSSNWFSRKIVMQSPSEQCEDDIIQSENWKKDANMNEVSALKNWDNRMKQRQRQQVHLTRKTNKQPDQLLMSLADDFRQIRQEREVIDRAIPLIDYGKGYRVGSEFWKQVEKIGDDDTGINMTLTTTEKGYAPPIEHIGKPASILQETTLAKEEFKKASTYYPWWKSSYLQTRKEQLKDIINELDPHKPYINKLEVVGYSINSATDNGLNNHPTEDISMDETEKELDDENDPFSAYADVVPIPVFGPSLVINGQSLQWTGSDVTDRGKSGPVIRLLFLSPINGNSLNALNVTNDGTAAVFYSWKLQSPEDPFGTRKGRPMQRFFFDIRSGVILPGDNIKIRFSFKSANAGIFSETWVLETQPVLCGGSQVQIVLKGIATVEDTQVEERKELERELAKRQALHTVDRILKDLLAGVRTPPKPGSPVDAYITDEEIFERMNEKLLYDSETVTELSALYYEITSGQHWNLSVRGITEAIKEIEDEDTREGYFETLNSKLEKMTKPRILATERTQYTVCYQLLCQGIDSFCEEALNLQAALGVPEKEFVVEHPQEEVLRKTKRAGDKTPDRRSEPKKDKKEPPSPVKGKSAGSSKTRSKDAVVIKPAAHNAEAKTDVAEEKSRDPLTEKYTEKLYTILYGIISNTVDKMEDLALVPV